jgi:4-amino-4-deoxy-L-arabinose transferase-like glycosyltransferase
VWGDEPFYLWLGRNWLTGAGYSFTGYSDVHHTPMYPFLSGVFYRLTGNMELASNICYLLFGTLLVIPIFLLARELYGRSVGYVSAALVAVYPAIATAPLYWGTLTEPPYYVFVYSALWLALVAMRRERAWWAYLSSGALLGLAYLTRPEAIAYVAVIGVVLVVVRLFERRLFARSTLAGLALFALGFLLFFGAYAFYVYRITGSWMVSEKAGVTFITCIGLSEGDTAAFDRATWGLDSTGLEVFFFSRESYHVSMIDIILAQPQAFVTLVARNMRRFVGSLLSTRLFSFYLLPLMGLAFLKKAWDKSRTKAELLLLGSLLPVTAFLLFFIQDRYIATLLPTLVIWLALGTYEVGVWLRDTVVNLTEGHPLPGGWRNLAPGLPVAALVLGLLLLQPRTIAQYTNIGSFRPEHKAVGLWLKDNIERDSVVMSRYPTIAFYADTRWEPTPNAELSEVLTYARANHVNYFVLDELETKEMRPQLAWLLDESAPPAELDVLQAFPSAQGKIIVYHLK